MGSDRFRFFNRLPANTPVRPQKIPPKSLFHNDFHVTALFPILCNGNLFYLHENKDSRGRGEGVPLSQCVQVLESTGDASTQLPATSYQLPLVPPAIPRQLLHYVPY